MVNRHSCVALLHGQTGSGKTTTCLKLAGKAAERSITVHGILETRATQGNVFLGYDVRDLESDETFTFARLKELSTGTDWLQHPGLRFAFSRRAIQRANDILQSITDRQPKRSLIIIDEFGRLEKAGEGIYQGILGIAEKPPDGVIVCTCRTDLAKTVAKVFRPSSASISMYTPLAAESLWSLCSRMLLPEVDLK